MPTFRPFHVLAATVTLATLGCQPGALVPAPAPAGTPTTAPASTPPAIERPAAARPPAPKRDTIYGFASVGSPLAGATVTFWDQQGTLIGEPLTTSPGGAWLRPTAGLPDVVVIKVAGGTLDGKPFDGELRAVSRRDTGRSDEADVNVVSTMAAAWLEQNPGAPIEPAYEKANTFLGIPAHYNLSRAARAFDVAGFLSPARGGAKAHLAAMTAEIAGGLRSTESIYDHAIPLKDPFVNLAKFTLEKFAGGLLEGAGSEAGGRLFQVLFGAPDAAVNQEMLDTMHRIEDKLDDVSRKLTQTSYDLAFDTHLREIMATTSTIQGDLSSALGYRLRGDTANAAAAIARYNGESETAADRADVLYLHNAMIGAMGTTSAIEAYSRKLVVDGAGFYGVNQATAMQDWWDTVDTARATICAAAWARLVKNGQATPDVLETWATWRDQELQKLKGITNYYDYVDLTKIPGGRAHSNALKAMDPRLIWQTDTNMVWSRNPLWYTVVPNTTPSDAQLAAYLDQVKRLGIFDDGWRIPYEDELQTMAGWDNDRTFTTRMAAAGFETLVGEGVCYQPRTPFPVCQQWESQNMFGQGCQGQPYQGWMGLNSRDFNFHILVDAWDDAYPWDFVRSNDTRKVAVHYMHDFDLNNPPFWYK